MDDLLTSTAIPESKGMVTKYVYLGVHLKSAFPLLYHTISHYTESPHFTTISQSGLFYIVHPASLIPDGPSLLSNFAKCWTSLRWCVVPGRPSVRRRRLLRFEFGHLVTCAP